MTTIDGIIKGLKGHDKEYAYLRLDSKGEVKVAGTGIWGRIVRLFTSEEAIRESHQRASQALIGQVHQMIGHKLSHLLDGISPGDSLSSRQIRQITTACEEKQNIVAINRVKANAFKGDSLYLAQAYEAVAKKIGYPLSFQSFRHASLSDEVAKFVDEKSDDQARIVTSDELARFVESRLESILETRQLTLGAIAASRLPPEEKQALVSMCNASADLDGFSTTVSSVEAELERIVAGKEIESARAGLFAMAQSIDNKGVFRYGERQQVFDLLLDTTMSRLAVKTGKDSDGLAREISQTMGFTTAQDPLQPDWQQTMRWLNTSLLLPLDAAFAEKLRLADPLTQLKPSEITFIDQFIAPVLEKLTQLAMKGEQGKEALFADISNALYQHYRAGDLPGKDPVAKLKDTEAWLATLPKVTHPRTGEEGVYLQVPGKGLEFCSDLSSLASDPEKAGRFIYYTNTNANKQGEGDIWRIYLNPDPEKTPELLQALDAESTSHPEIHSFKTAGSASIHSQLDKVVVYVHGKEKAQELAQRLQQEARRFGFSEPLPAMLDVLHPGVGLGREPGTMETGFSPRTSPKEAARQSFGTIRAQLLAAALTNFVANRPKENAENYLKNLDELKKYVAIAFSSHRNIIEPL